MIRRILILILLMLAAGCLAMLIWGDLMPDPKVAQTRCADHLGVKAIYQEDGKWVVYCNDGEQVW